MTRLSLIPTLVALSSGERVEMVGEVLSTVKIAVDAVE
jgi:hypothetical protein